METLVDSHYLRSAGRRVKTPFQTRVSIHGEPHVLTCNRVLRVLPGKRLVCFGEWGGGRIVAKFFFDPRRAKRHCRREATGVSALLHSDAAAPKLLFNGTLWHGGTPVLGIERIESAEDLADLWEKTEHDELRGKLLAYAATALADQHKAGLWQKDPYRKNFLLAGTTVYSIDGDGIATRKSGKPLPKLPSLRNFGLFLAQFYPRFTHLFKDAFAAYTKRRNWSGGVGLDELMREVRRQFDHRKRIRLKKVFRESTALVCRHTWHYFMMCDRSNYSPGMIAFLKNPDQKMEEGRILKAGNSATVALVEIDGAFRVVKRYNIKNFGHAVKRGLRRSRAWISWRNAHLLGLLFVPTARPIAFKEYRIGFLRRRAYYITAYLEGEDARRLLPSRQLTLQERQEIVERIVDLMQSFADAKVSHGDCKATNFIIGDRGVSVIDLDALRQHRFRRQFHRAFKKDCRRMLKNWEKFPDVDVLFQRRMAMLKF